MCGIFAYLNYCTPKRRDEILTILVDALKKLAYKGYDSAGLAIDSALQDDVILIRNSGEISGLEAKIGREKGGWELDQVHRDHVGIAHTRWATHGPPSLQNTHPIPSSDQEADFIVVHNGMLTNYKELKAELSEDPRYARFQSETDTEVVAKYAKLIFDASGGKEAITLREIVEQICLKLNGAYALVFKSKHYPNECVAATRSSPLVIGIKTRRQLWTNHIPVYYSEGMTVGGSNTELHPRGSDPFKLLNIGFPPAATGNSEKPSAVAAAADTTTTIMPSAAVALDSSCGPDKQPSGSKDDVTGRQQNGGTPSENGEASDESGIEFFFSSDSKAIAPFTNKVIFMKDDDIAAVGPTGVLSIHRIKREAFIHNLSSAEQSQSNGAESRQIDTLDCKAAQLDIQDKLLKEIGDQVDSVFNTMRGRVRFAANVDADDVTGTGTVVLGGIRDFVPEIRRCRRVLLMGCGTSYHVGLATRQILEELTLFPVMVDTASDFLDRQTPVFRDDVCFFLSQSGETNDILEALRLCKREGALVVGVTNVVGSSLSRESHCGIHLNTGPDVVLTSGPGHSIKAFASQFVSLVMFGLVMSEDICSKQERRREIIQGLRELPDTMQKVLARGRGLRGVAERLKEEKSIVILGRGYSYAACLEGALKIKELTGVHCEALLAGELAHGPMTSQLLNKQNMAVVVVISNDAVHKKSLDTLKKIASGGCNPMVICSDAADKDKEITNVTQDVVSLPNSVDCLQGIVTVMAMQLLTYHLAKIRVESD